MKKKVIIIIFFLVLTITMVSTALFYYVHNINNKNYDGYKLIKYANFNSEKKTSAHIPYEDTIVIWEFDNNRSFFNVFKNGKLLKIPEQIANSEVWRIGETKNYYANYRNSQDEITNIYLILIILIIILTLMAFKS